MTIKAISLWEPWATAMAWNLKRNETRSWPTGYKGPLAICSAARKMTKEELPIFEFIQSIQPAITEPTYGKILCIVEIYDCISTSLYKPNSQWEYRLGNYTGNRFVWITRNVQRLREPVPIRGQQGLWTLSNDIANSVAAQL